MADSTEETSAENKMEEKGAQDHDDGIREIKDAAESGNKFQQAVAAWRTLDLTTMVSTFDTVAEEIVTQQKDSLVQRKELAQKTKDFRKLDDEAKLAEIRELLKAYQGYVDVLTNHNKTITSAFMQAYSPLSEAPDPYPLLEASIDSLVTVDEVVPRLESENQRLQKQVTKLNGQAEEAEKQLEEERTKRLSSEESQDDRIKEVEASWSAVLKEKEDNSSTKMRNLEEKVENQERLLKELKASYEVSQRLEKSGEDPQDLSRGTATAAELDFANSELEKVSIRLAEVEARNEQLRIDLAQSTSQSNSSARSTAVEDDPAFLRLRSENTSLLRRLDSARYDKDTERSNLETKLRSVEREVGSIKADRDTLQSKVQKWSDYEEVKRELDMLRAIEFATVGDADDEESAHTNGSADRSGSETLEQLLVARNKKLSNELTELRVSQQELQQRLEQLQEDLSSTNMDLEKARNLNVTLENDLQKTQQEAFNAFETTSVAGTYTSRYPKSSYGSRRGGGGGGGPSPTSSIIGGFDPTGTSSPRTLDALRGNEPVGGGSGILLMVTAQRDRFKKKITELESELQKQYQTVSSLRSEVSSLQKDNLTLYEKSRYVSSYNRAGGGGGGRTTSSAAYAANPNPSSIRMGPDSGGGGGGGSGASDRYRSAYESNLSPFAAFRGRESARALKRMSLPERAVFQVTRMVLATRTSRNLFAAYCVALHLLVLLMLYWMSTESFATGVGALGEVGTGAAGLAAGGGGTERGEWIVAAAPGGGAAGGAGVEEDY